MTAPAVTSLNISSGSEDGGDSVVITGTTLTGATAVLFGTVPATSFVVNSATQITAVSPAHALGLIDITVTTPGGTSSTGSGDQYTFATVLPIVTSVTPSTGNQTGNVAITLVGSNFTRVTAVKVATVNVTSFVIVNSTHITAYTAAFSGATHITVVNSAGTSATGSGNAYTGAIVTSTAYTQRDGSSDGTKFYQDIEISPATLHSGELVKRLDPIVYPEKGVIHAPKNGLGSAQDTPPLNVS